MKMILALFMISSLFFGCTPKRSINDCEGYATNPYSQDIRWRDQEPVTFIIHPNIDPKYHQIIYNSAKIWETAIGHKVFNFIIGTGNISEQNHRDYKNVISFSSTWDENNSSEQGRTSVLWKDNQIIETDIMINFKNFKYYSILDPKKVIGNQNLKSDLYNLEALLIHEMGHSLGLIHRDQSVMETHLAAHNDRISLTPKDLKSIQCGYKTSEISMASTKDVK